MRVASQPTRRPASAYDFESTPTLTARADLSAAAGRRAARLLLEPAVDLVAHERRAVALHEPDKLVELRRARVHAGRVVREVDDHRARVWPESGGDSPEVERPAILRTQVDEVHLGTLRAREVVERLVGGPQRDHVIARPDERREQQEERLAGADDGDRVVGGERLVEARDLARRSGEPSVSV